MGALGSCLRSKTRDGGDLELSLRSRSGSRSPDLGAPEPVQDLTVQQASNGAPPSEVTLTWNPPDNFSRPRDVSHYYIKVSSKLTNKVLKEVEVRGDTTTVDFSGDEALEPLHTYIFAVQAMGSNHITGDWNMVEGFIDWLCRFPTCNKNRLKIEGGVYDFCSRDHKVAFDDHHCLYGGCIEPAVYSASPEPQRTLLREKSHFCSHDHYYRVLKTESGVQHGFFLEVERTSQEYKAVEDHFKRKWSSNRKERKSPPSLRLVLAIFNPSLDERFTNYKQVHMMDREKQTKLVKKLFFGTTLKCDLHTYQIPCKHGQCRVCKISCTQGNGDHDSCGVCELALHGLDRLSMSGVTLDKNPGQSHEKAGMHMESLTYGLLMCEVACVNTKSYSRTTSDTDLRPRPEGFDAIKIHNRSRSRSLLKHSTDEVVVYKADAVCPRYILLYV